MKHCSSPTRSTPNRQFPRTATLVDPVFASIHPSGSSRSSRTKEPGLSTFPQVKNLCHCMLPRAVERRTHFQKYHDKVRRLFEASLEAISLTLQCQMPVARNLLTLLLETSSQLSKAIGTILEPHDTNARVDQIDCSRCFVDYQTAYRNCRSMLEG